jgi:polyisoprenoid-binding protein YceI
MSHEGLPYEVVPAQSLLTIRVYRGGTLAKAGHNHLVASHDLTGTAYLPDDLTRASFELRFPVAGLTVDEAQLRALEGADFAAEVPDSARQGTRQNMLGEALLDAEHYPQIVLRSGQVDVAAPHELLVHTQITVRDHTSQIVVPVHLLMAADGLTVDGEFSLTHADLGLTPFSIMMGAMQVQDEMKIRFRIHCVPSPQG